MEMDASKSEFYKSRSLAGRVGTAFRFINANFRYLFKQSAFILIPLALVQALYFTLFAGDPVVSAGRLVVSALFSVLSIAGGLLYYSFLYTCLQKYIESGYLPACKLRELFRPVLQNAKKLFYVGFFILLFYSCLLLIAWLGMLVSFYTLIVLLPLFVFLLVPLSYFGFAYVLEHEAMGVAFKSSYRLGICYWGSTFAMLLVGTVLTGIVQSVVFMPLGTSLYVERMVNMAVLQGNEAVLPGFFPFLLFFLAFVSMFFLFLSMILPVLLMAFQYGSAVAARREKEAEYSGNEKSV